MSAAPDLCRHGDHRSVCIECMFSEPTAPGAKSPEQLLTASRWIVAKFDGRCGHKYAHEVAVGDPLGWCDDLNAWVCARCAR